MVISKCCCCVVDESNVVDSGGDGLVGCNVGCTR